MGHPVILNFGPGNYRPQASAAGLAASAMLDLTNSDLQVWEFPKNVERVIYLGPPHRIIDAPTGDVEAYLNYTAPYMTYPTTTTTVPGTSTTTAAPTTTTPSGGWTIDWVLLWRAIAEGEPVDTAWSQLDFAADVPNDSLELSEVSGTFDPSWQVGDKVEFGIMRDGDDAVNDKWDNVAWWLHLQIHYNA